MDMDLSLIPLDPGVYLFKSGQGKIKCLRKRLASYFRGKNLSPKTQAMLRQASSLDTLTTTTEKEALLLEAELIKKHRPRYNITLRDDKQYFLFCMDKSHPYPRLAVIRPRPGRAATGAGADNSRATHKKTRHNRNLALFGPYASGLAARETWRLIHHIFPLRRCSDRMFKNRVRPCLYYQMNQCLGPCCLPVNQAEYADMTGEVELLLLGKSSELINQLKTRMQGASDTLEFELAARLRDQIRAVEKTVEQQAVVFQQGSDLDALGLAETAQGLALGVLFVRNGKVMDSRTFFWPGLTLAEGAEALNSFLGQFYAQAALIPPRILLPWRLSDMDEADSAIADSAINDEAAVAAINEAVAAGTGEAAADCPAPAPEQSRLWEEILSETRQAQVKLLLPRDERERRLVRMAEANARQSAKTTDAQPLAHCLAQRLHLAAPPERIEAVDVSHTGGQETRVGMVVFVDAEPRREEFRAYTLPGNNPAVSDQAGGQAAAFAPGDDYGALAAWVVRRLESGPPWPDLLLIDGGLGQLAVVERALADAGQADLFPIAAIAKARNADGRADRRAGNTADRIFIPGRKNHLPLPEGSPELLFLQRVRDTVHDYAIGRHRRARNKAALAGALLEVPGVGPKTAALLWDNFDSLAEMAAASEAVLAALPGIGKGKAKKLKRELARFAKV